MSYYKNFSLKKLTTPAFSHIWLLLYWPFYGLMFLALERFLPLQFHEIYSHADNLIPFCEYFVFPYYAWFAFLAGMLVYLFFTDIPGFRQYMWFIIISYSVTVVIYLLYPSCQNLRPTEFARDNFCTDIVKFLYGFDTNTNVCPSLHVIGMMAAFFGGWKTPKMRHWGWKIFWIISAILVCASTVFLKQHSIIDIYAGLAVTAVTYVVVYLWMPKKFPSLTLDPMVVYK